MRVGRWNITRGEDRRVAYEGYKLLLVAMVPTLLVWRSPRYVVWGARSSDVLIGSQVDLVRQEMLNRQARMARGMIRLQLQIRDEFTPVIARAAAAMAEFNAAMAKVGQAHTKAGRIA